MLPGSLVPCSLVCRRSSFRTALGDAGGGHVGVLGLTTLLWECDLDLLFLFAINSCRGVLDLFSSFFMLFLTTISCRGVLDLCSSFLMLRLGGGGGVGITFRLGGDGAVGRCRRCGGDGGLSGLHVLLCSRLLGGVGGLCGVHERCLFRGLSSSSGPSAVLFTL